MIIASLPKLRSSKLRVQKPPKLPKICLLKLGFSSRIMGLQRGKRMEKDGASFGKDFCQEIESFSWEEKEKRESAKVGERKGNFFESFVSWLLSLKNNRNDIKWSHFMAHRNQLELASRCDVIDFVSLLSLVYPEQNTNRS